MPMFDYRCRACGQTFEYLTRPGHDAACPACRSTDLEKLLSHFKVGPPVPTAAQKEAEKIRRAGWVPIGRPQRTRR
jgi:putative FmdB family regulatory protein